MAVVRQTLSAPHVPTDSCQFGVMIALMSLGFSVLCIFLCAQWSDFSLRCIHIRCSYPY